MNELLHVFEMERALLPGWCSSQKARKLIETILDLKPALAVEIGVFGGSSLIPQALAFQHLGQGRIVGIDPYSTEAALESMIAEKDRKWWSNLDLESIRQKCMDSVERLHLMQQALFMRAKAENAAFMFSDGSIGVLHIDGNHSECQSMKDVMLYLPKVQNGGYIFFDDISWTEKTVKTTRGALRYLLEHGCEQVDEVDDCAILRHNGRKL